MAQVAQDFRKTASGLKLGKMLFDPSQTSSLTSDPTQIVSLLKSAGVPIPKGVQVSADTAQIIMAGGSFITNAQKGASIKQVLYPTATAMRAAVDLFEITGLMDPKSPAAQIMTIGSDLAMVVGSGGMNIVADIGLILDVASVIQNWQGSAQRLADQQLSQALALRKEGQANDLAKNFSRYQAGLMGVFTFIAMAAEQSPDMFTKYFPQLGAFVPTTYITITTTATTRSWWGDSQSATAQAVIASIDNDKNKIANAVVDKYVKIPLALFGIIANEARFGSNVVDRNGKYVVPPHPQPLPRISLKALAALSMMPPYINNFPLDFDMPGFLQSLQLTPGDIDPGFIPNVACQNLDFFPSNNKSLSSEQVFQRSLSGIASRNIFSPIPRPVMTQEIRNLISWDKSGNISQMLNNTKQGRAIIKEWGTIPTLNSQKIDFNLTQASGTGTNPGDPLGGFILGQGLADRFLVDAIDISQYTASISFLKTLQTSWYFGGSSGAVVDYSGYQWADRQADIEVLHRDLMHKSISRKLNLKALENISRYLGVAPTKLRRYPLEQGKLAAYYAA